MRAVDDERIVFAFTLAESTDDAYRAFAALATATTVRPDAPPAAWLRKTAPSATWRDQYQPAERSLWGELETLRAITPAGSYTDALDELLTRRCLIAA